MITLFGFGNIFEGGRGETKDLRAQWAFEETGLPYRFEALDQTKGDLETDAYRQISPFRQAPVIDDEGFVVAESAAVVLYVAEKAGKLFPSDVQGRTRVMQWCFAATSTVEPTLQCMTSSRSSAAPISISGRKCASSPTDGSATSTAASKAENGSRATSSRRRTS